MSDDLVERLRDWPYQGETMAEQAADLIEELEAALRNSALQELSALGQATEAYQAQLAAEARIVDIEAKLAKAREEGFWAGRSCGGAKKEIDATLAELKGQE